jgi:hypothetical protein
MTIRVMRLLFIMEVMIAGEGAHAQPMGGFIRPASDEQHRGYENKRCTDDQDIDRIGQPHVCLLALTVRYYVRFVSAQSQFCAALRQGAVENLSKSFNNLFLSDGYGDSRPVNEV